MKKFFSAALFMVLISTTVFAQNNNRGQRQRLDPTEMHNRMAERLAKDMKLDDDKAGFFKVLYLDYQTARQNAVNPKGEVEERVDMKKLTDEKATELIEKHFAAQEAQLAVDKEYYAKFIELITPAQAAQIFLQRQGGGMQRQGGMNGGRPGGFGGPGGFRGQGGFGRPDGFGE